MKTTFTSHQHKITPVQISSYFEGFVQGVEELDLYNIQLLPAGHGHYSIEATFIADGEEIVIEKTTNNMQLVDAWKSGMQDMYENGEDGFDDWDDVVDTMLSTINAEDDIILALN